MLSVTTAPLSVEAVTTQVEASVRLRGEGCGAVASFLGLVRATHKAAALGMIGVTVGYLAAGTLLAPLLWVDPLGPFIKTLPGAVLALVALAVAEER